MVNHSGNLSFWSTSNTVTIRRLQPELCQPLKSVFSVFCSGNPGFDGFRLPEELYGARLIIGIIGSYADHDTDSIPKHIRLYNCFWLVSAYISFDGIGGSRTRVQRLVQRTSTIIVCYFGKPRIPFRARKQTALPGR